MRGINKVILLGTYRPGTRDGEYQPFELCVREMLPGGYSDHIIRCSTRGKLANALSLVEAGRSIYLEGSLLPVADGSTVVADTIQLLGRS